jgi:hypothetical protein
MQAKSGTHLEKGVLFFRLEFIRTKEVQTMRGFLRSKTLVGALQKLEDIFDDYSFEIDLFLIVKLFCLELNLVQE